MCGYPRACVWVPAREAWLTLSARLSPSMHLPACLPAEADEGHSNALPGGVQHIPCAASNEGISGAGRHSPAPHNSRDVAEVQRLPVPWLDGLDGSQASEKKEPRPRRWQFAMLPFMYALVFGCGGLFMIATLAAGLGANNTRAWLISAAVAVVLKVFVADPIKVCVLTAFLQFAEDYTRKALVKARDTAGSVAASATALAAQAGNAAAAQAASAAALAAQARNAAVVQAGNIAGSAVALASQAGNAAVSAATFASQAAAKSFRLRRVGGSAE